MTRKGGGRESGGVSVTGKEVPVGGGMPKQQSGQPPETAAANPAAPERCHECGHAWVQCDMDALANRETIRQLEAQLADIRAEKAEARLRKAIELLNRAAKQHVLWTLGGKRLHIPKPGGHKTVCGILESETRYGFGYAWLKPDCLSCLEASR